MLHCMYNITKILYSIYNMLVRVATDPKVNKDLRHFSVPYSLHKYSLDKASSMHCQPNNPI